MRMRPGTFDSTNPALRGEAWQGELSHVAGETATIEGVVNKTGMLTALCVGGGMCGIALIRAYPAMMWPLFIVSIIAVIGVYIAIFSNPLRARTTAWIYALVEGAMLGVLTDGLDRTLASMEIAVTGGIALQAFVITFCVLMAMLVLYRMKILKPTRRFAAVLSTMTLGILLIYVVSFVMAIFGAQMPFLSLGSAFAGGNTALIGLGINVLILGVASLWLIMDFGLVEQQVAAGAPKAMEWYCGFALLVTLAWIYLEAVKLVFRIAVMMNHRK